MVELTEEKENPDNATVAVEVSSWLIIGPSVVPDIEENLVLVVEESVRVQLGGSLRRLVEVS